MLPLPADGLDSEPRLPVVEPKPVKVVQDWSDIYDEFDDNGGRSMPGHLTQEDLNAVKHRFGAPRPHSRMQTRRIKELHAIAGADDSDQYDIFDDDPQFIKSHA